MNINHRLAEKAARHQSPIRMRASNSPRLRYWLWITWSADLISSQMLRRSRNRVGVALYPISLRIGQKVMNQRKTHPEQWWW